MGRSGGPRSDDEAVWPGAPNAVWVEPMKATHLMSWGRLDTEEVGDVGDGGLAGGVDKLGEAVAGGRQVLDRGEDAGGFFKVGGVATWGSWR